jgi:hypothetical protein
MRFVFALLAVCVTTASAQACGFMGQPPYYPAAPITPAPTMIQPFGNGAIINTPDQLPTTVWPFTNGYMINTPGKRPTNCQRFGAAMVIPANFWAT